MSESLVMVSDCCAKSATFLTSVTFVTYVNEATAGTTYCRTTNVLDEKKKALLLIGWLFLLSLVLPPFP
jgi:hypothetical protein